MKPKTPGAAIYERRGELPARPKVTISGSFNRHLDEVGLAIDGFNFLGAEVLSPQDNAVVDRLGQFVFLDSDRRRSIKGVQNRHLAAIDNSDLLYVVCPDGYVGHSVCLEVGYAISRKVPILASGWPADDTVKQYVNQIASPNEAIEWLDRQKRLRAVGRGLILLSPEEVVDVIHDKLEAARKHLTAPNRRSDNDPAEKSIEIARKLLWLPSRTSD